VAKTEIKFDVGSKVFTKGLKKPYVVMDVLASSPARYAIETSSGKKCELYENGKSWFLRPEGVDARPVQLADGPSRHHAPASVVASPELVEQVKQDLTELFGEPGVLETAPMDEQPQLEHEPEPAPELGETVEQSPWLSYEGQPDTVPALEPESVQVLEAAPEPPAEPMGEIVVVTVGFESTPTRKTPARDSRGHFIRRSVSAEA